MTTASIPGSASSSAISVYAVVAPGAGAQFGYLGGGGGAAQPVAEPLGGARGRVGDGRETGAGETAGEGLGVEGAHAAGADETDGEGVSRGHADAP
ncbi:hypothetical protein ACFWMG_17710 [Streptomyces sp. NPDC127074]|uniref:hypothetical protein n=1 Tax=Streptomyces sp. NPDC127074 TaxID=3347130 RepID=UPI00366649A2